MSIGRNSFNLYYNSNLLKREKGGVMKKLLVCDVEGTIFKAKYKIEGTDYASTMWQPLANILGEKAIEEERETHTKWENKEYGNYLDWVNATVAIHKEHKLHRDDFYQLIDGAEYIDGVKDFFKNLDRSKYIPVLVSGGFQELVKRAQVELGINYGYGACEYFFNDRTGMLDDHSLTPCDFEGKYNFIKYLFNIYELNPLTDWVFAGDGKNDVHIAKKAPLSFGINAHPELASLVTHNIKDFSKIDHYLKNEESSLNISSDDFISIDDFSRHIDYDYTELSSELSELKRNLTLVNSAILEIEDENSILDELLYEASKESEEKGSELDRLKEITDQHINEKSFLEKRFDKLTKKLENESAKRKKLLQDSWEIHFPKFLFEPAPIRDISKLNHNERLMVEKELRKLHDSIDPRTLSIGKLSSGNDHMGLRLLDGFPARIEYTQISKANKRYTRIITFYKHNKKYMQ